MKKITLIVVLFVFGINMAQAQQKNDWIKVNTEKDENLVQGTVKDAQGNIYLLMSDKKGYGKNQGVIIKKYGADCEFISKVRIAGEMPSNFITRIINEYVFVLPITGMGQHNQSGYVKAYNLDGSLSEKLELDPKFEYTCYNVGSKGFGYEINRDDYNNFKLSKCGKYYVTWGYSRSSKPGDSKYQIKAYAFNLNLDKVGETEFSFETVFGAESEIESLVIDYTLENKFICITHNTEKPSKANLMMAVFDGKTDKPTMYKYTLQNDWTSFNYVPGKFGEVYILGLTGKSIKNIFTDGFLAETIFFISQPLDQAAVKPVIHNIPSYVKNSFPIFRQFIQAKMNFYHPDQLFIMDDGILWLGISAGETDGDKDIIDYRSQAKKTMNTINKIVNGDDEKYFYTNTFSFFKFSFSGNIQWIECIPRRMRISYPLSIYSSYGTCNDGNKLRLAYNDYFKNASKPNIHDAVPIVQTNVVPVYTEIFSDGTIKVKALENEGDGCLYYTPQALFQDNYGYYISIKTKVLALGDLHISKIDLDE